LQQSLEQAAVEEALYSQSNKRECTAMCILAMQRLNILLELLSNKASIIKKKYYFSYTSFKK
jgi:hypothetical protein